MEVQKNGLAEATGKATPKPEGCNCLTDIRDRLKEHLGDPEVSLVLGFVNKDNQLVAVNPLEVEYRKRGRDGEFSKKKYTVNITPKYCQFCARPLFPEKEEDKEVQSA